MEISCKFEVLLRTGEMWTEIFQTWSTCSCQWKNRWYFFRNQLACQLIWKNTTQKRKIFVAHVDLVQIKKSLQYPFVFLQYRFQLVQRFTVNSCMNFFQWGCRRHKSCTSIFCWGLVGTSEVCPEEPVLCSKKGLKRKYFFQFSGPRKVKENEKSICSEDPFREQKTGSEVATEEVHKSWGKIREHIFASGVRTRKNECFYFCNRV